jgi:hypothetical protein
MKPACALALYAAFGRDDDSDPDKQGLRVA